DRLRRAKPGSAQAVTLGYDELAVGRDAHHGAAARARWRTRLGGDEGEPPEQAAEVRRPDGRRDLAAARGEAHRHPAPGQLHAQRGGARDGELERLGAGARVVVEDDRRLAPLVVLVLAHQQHSAPRARAPVDAARIVAFTKSAQPRQLALPAGSLVA